MKLGVDHSSECFINLRKFRTLPEKINPGTIRVIINKAHIISISRKNATREGPQISKCTRSNKVHETTCMLEMGE